MSYQQWYTPFDTPNFGNSPLHPNPIRSYHSSDESDPGSHGGGGLRPSGREFHGRHTPSFSSHGHLLVDDSPYLPRREPLQQFVSPASLHLDAQQQYHHDYSDRSQIHYRPHVEEQWAGPMPGSPPPGYYEPAPFNFSGAPQMPSAFPPSVFQQPSSRYPDAGDYLRQQLNLPPNAPVNLWSVPEPQGGEKPSIPLPMLIKLAIYGSQKKRLTLQEIYSELAGRFQWFREHQQESAWKNSIRHNLSLNKVFKNMQRPVTEPGKGSYWELDVSEGEGYKRPRKRLNQKQSRLGPVDEDEVSEDGSYSDNDHGDTEYRGQGRHRSPYAQDRYTQQQQPRHGLRVKTDQRDSSSPPTTSSSRGGSIPIIDPPASQRRTTASTYMQPGYNQGYGHIDPAFHNAHAGPSTSGPSSYMAMAASTQYPSVHALHSRSSTPVDVKPPRPTERVLRPRLSSTGLPASSSSSSSAPLSPTDEAYAKSRRRARS